MGAMVNGFFIGIYFSAVLGVTNAQHPSTTLSFEVDNLIREHRWNQALMQSLVDDYEIVYPFQVRDRSRVAIDTRNYYFSNATIHYDRCTFVIKSSYNRFKLHLAQNRLLIPPGASYKQVFNDTHRSETRGESIEHCFYQGEVHGEETSKVALSTCEGLRGVIITGNQTFFVIPLQGGDFGRRHAHILIRAKFHQKLNCAVNGVTEWSLAANRRQPGHSKRRHRRDAEKETKYIELAIVADQASFVDLNASFVSLMRFVLEAVNGMDMILSDLNTRVTLVYVEAYTRKNPIDISEDITQTMLNFVKFASTVVHSDKLDMMLFMTSSKFLRQESALAIPNSVCTARAAGVVSNPSPFEEHQLSVLMSHSAAHILGIKHDTAGDECSCPDRFGCVMSPTLSGKRHRFVHRFTSCNNAEYGATLSSSQARCLFNKPLEDSGLSSCGNRVVDRGEQCDCGSVEECESVDPCCDPVTCTLKRGAECGVGECCRNCKLLPSSHVCRPAADDCDVPELCTSKSGQCPVDAFRLNGDVCDSGDGYCYNGRCSSANRQCVDLWEYGATRAEPECFSKFNPIGIESGNCGYDERSRGQPCKVENAMCGLLHCKGGVEVPRSPSYYKTEFSLEGKLYECKTITSGNNKTYSPGMVKDGTKCGPNKICLNQACVDVSNIVTEPECKTNNIAIACSGHGICTTENTCYCNSGWTGEDCGLKIDSSVSAAPTEPALVATTRKVLYNASVPRSFLNDRSFNHPNISLAGKLDTYTMLIILGGVAGAVFVLLLFLVLCYRRRTKTNLRKKLAAKKKEFDRESESSVDTARRSIRFGNLPSYRDEKIQMKQHKKRTLHQIKETDEKDSVSSKSRESGHSGVPNGEVFSYEDADYHQQKQYYDSNGRPPDRGILKNGGRSMSDVEQCSPLLQRPADGYESEPPYAASYNGCRVFQNSLRRLNECDIYRHRNMCDEGASPCSDVQQHQQQPNFLLQKRGSASSNMSDRTPPPHCRPTDADTPPSPRASLTQMDQNNALSEKAFCKPQPLQLKNIEYLLRQLDQKCFSAVSASSSTTEMSAAEADKNQVDDQREEVGSNTESHRDGGYCTSSALGSSDAKTTYSEAGTPVQTIASPSSEKHAENVMFRMVRR